MRFCENNKFKGDLKNAVLHCTDEHTSCINYNTGKRALIEVQNYKDGEEIVLDYILNCIVFVVRGSLRYQLGVHPEKTLVSKEALFVPGHYKCRAVAEGDTTIMVFRLEKNVIFCDSYIIDNLVYDTQECPMVKDESLQPYHLPFNDLLDDYLLLLEKFLSHGMKCYIFLSNKIDELFFIFRGFYDKEELGCFFKKAMSNDSWFSNYIFQNASKYKSVTELASSMNYTVSGFEKRFKRVFGISCYFWMKEQKARMILHELNTGDKPIKEISEDFGFSSTSAFSEFCKSMLGKPPGQIRKPRSNYGGNNKQQGEKS